MGQTILSFLNFRFDCSGSQVFAQHIARSSYVEAARSKGSDVLVVQPPAEPGKFWSGQTAYAFAAHAHCQDLTTHRQSMAEYGKSNSESNELGDNPTFYAAV